MTSCDIISWVLDILHMFFSTLFQGTFKEEFVTAGGVPLVEVSCDSAKLNSYAIQSFAQRPVIFVVVCQCYFDKNVCKRMVAMSDLLYVHMMDLWYAGWPEDHGKSKVPRLISGWRGKVFSLHFVSLDSWNLWLHGLYLNDLFWGYDFFYHDFLPNNCHLKML